MYSPLHLLLAHAADFDHRSRRRRALIVRAAALALFAMVLSAALLAAPTVANAESTNRAANLRWPGYIDTDLKYADFFAFEHTIAARFMLQHPRAYRGPIVSVAGRNISYQIGQGDYLSGTKGPKLALKVDGDEHLFSIGGAALGKWHHVAVVRRYQYWQGQKVGSRFDVYFDGAHLCPDGESCFEPDFGGSSPAAPGGTLRIGRSIPGKDGTEQFYGFVDDVAVFSKALTGGELAALAIKKRLDGTESGLLRAWTFDDATPSGSPLPAALSHAPEMEQGAATKIVSPIRDSAADAALLPLPHAFYSPLLRLPFKAGKAWRVTQGSASGSSHSGPYAFSLDLALDDEPSPGKAPNPHSPNDPACGEPVLAAAPGELVWAHDSGGFVDSDNPPGPNGINDDFDANNLAMVEVAPFAIAGYMHTFTGSISDAFSFVELPPWGNALPVWQDRQLGTVGTRNGCHLHFSITNTTGDKNLNPLEDGPDLPNVTYPALYFDYQACDADIDADAGKNLDGGKTCDDPANWYDVSYGVPAAGQRIKRM